VECLRFRSRNKAVDWILDLDEKTKDGFGAWKRPSVRVKGEQRPADTFQGQIGPETGTQQARWQSMNNRPLPFRFPETATGRF